MPPHRGSCPNSMTSHRERNASEEELEVPIPKIDTTHLSESDFDSNSDTSSAPTVRDLEEIKNIDDLPIYDDAGVNLDSYFYPEQKFLQSNDIFPLDLCTIPENLYTSVEPVNMCNQDNNNSILLSTPISHTSPNSHLSHNSTASSSGPRKSVRLAQRVDLYNKIADVMNLKRFQLLRRNLHFVDNSIINTEDCNYKVRPILEHVRKNCLEIYQGSQFFIDKMMIPYKRIKAGTRRQYIKNKLKKWGFKMFVRSGIYGFVYDFLPYGGENTFHRTSFTEYENMNFGLGQKVIVELCKSIPCKPFSVVCFDNWFTSLELVTYLRKSFGILSLGTIQQNRLRGSSSETVSRYDKNEKERVNVKFPKVIKKYNSHMGGVDLADIFVSLYRTSIKSHRWYLAIFSQLLDNGVNNV
ncbi:hypothetical protein AGLY_012316 [Aphis glycines]|uniref:PiggyBac transposable element-derived protein domain-containing protein n=1 Tax=Aphis glycines TaxID=307491 RepID=A0A6G0TB21_APHGL|nr:hypothetical protein AGLY_012316 [Aphis glycines]